MTNIARARDIELSDNMIWSVQLEAASWADDTFNGTFDECLDYARENDYKLDGEEARIALIELDEKGCSVFCHEVYIDNQYADESDRRNNFEHHQYC